AAQEVGRREAGRAAADNSNRLARGFTGRGQLGVLLDRPIADVLFDRVDTDEVVDLVAIAAVFAGGRAYAAHHGGERVRLHHAVEGVFLPGRAGDWRLVHLSCDGKPAADLVAGWAGALAGRRAVDIGGTFIGMVRLENLVGQVVPAGPHVVAVL